MKAKLLATFCLMALLSLVHTQAGIQSDKEFWEYLLSQSIPIEEVRAEGDLLVVKLNYQTVPSSKTMRENIVTVFQKAAEKNLDVSYVCMDILLDGEPNTRMAVPTGVALDCAGGKISAEEMMEQVLVTSDQNISELVAGGRIPGSEAEEGSGVEAERVDDVESGEISDRIETIDTEKEGIEPKPVKPRQDRTGGGGAPAIVVLFKQKNIQLLIVIGLFCLGCLILIVGIRALNRRQSESVSKVKASLDVQYEDSSHKIFLIQKARTTIGRDEKNDLVLHDVNVSAFHAEITASSGAFILKDLNSTNGTFVNGVRVTQKSLFLEDEIVIGSTKLLVKS